MQALTVAYEPPTLPELAVLTQIDDLRRLADLVHKCDPVLQIRSDDKVTFTESEFKERLSEVFFEHADSSSTARKRYHGLMALRCFKYINSSYGEPEEFDHSSDATTGLRHDDSITHSPITAALVNDGEVLVVTQDDDVSRVVDSAIPATSIHGCHYPVRFLFQHLSEGFPDAVQELVDDDPDFWGGQSSTRDRWLADFRSLTTNFKDLNTHGMSTLHVAAGIGANDLVSILINRNGDNSSSWTNTDGMTAVSSSPLYFV